MSRPFHSGSPASATSGKRRTKRPNVSWPCIRASVAPKQVWIPRANDRCSPARCRRSTSSSASGPQCVASDAVFTLNSSLYSKLPYDPVKDLVPVARLVTANLMLVTRPDFPATSVKEFIEYAKRNPGKLTYGSVGAGGVNHLAMSWFNNLNGLQMEHVPYKGLVQALQDIVTGRVDGMFAVIGGALPFVQSGQLKALAVSGKARNAALPNVPTFAEVGYPNFDASFYFALAAPAGTPRDILQKVAADSSDIVRSPEFRDKQLAVLGFEGAGETPDQFAAFLVNDRKVGAEKVKVSGAKLD